MGRRDVTLNSMSYRCVFKAGWIQITFCGTHTHTHVHTHTHTHTLLVSSLLRSSAPLCDVRGTGRARRPASRQALTARGSPPWNGAKRNEGHPRFSPLRQLPSPTRVSLDRLGFRPCLGLPVPANVVAWTRVVSSPFSSPLVGRPDNNSVITLISFCTCTLGRRRLAVAKAALPGQGPPPERHDLHDSDRHVDHLRFRHSPTRRQSGSSPLPPRPGTPPQDL